MSLTIDDADLIRSFKLGDDTVFEAIVTEYRPELLRHARRRASDAGTAEDLVQETFVRAYRAFARLRDDSCVRPWLHHILANVCIDEANRARREHDKTARAGLDPLLYPMVPGIEDQLGLDIDSDSISHALSRLPDTHRDALTMRFVEQLEYDEIAAHTGISELNVRARVSRARSAMRHALQAAGAAVAAGIMVLRRGARTAVAASATPDSAGAAAASGSAGHAGRLATTLAPAIEAANAVAVSSQGTLPMLAKAAVGVGAVAVVALSAGPEQPVERVVPVVAEAAAASAAPDLSIGDTIIVRSTPSAAPADEARSATPATRTGGALTLALADTPQAATPETTLPATTVPATTAPATTLPSTTVPPTTLPATTVVVPSTLFGGSFDAAISVSVAGPRLDLSGQVTMAVAETTASGSLTGRLGVEPADPDGTRRISGVLTLQLDTGTIELRLAGYGSSTDQSAEADATPTSMTLSGVYRASGTTGQLALSGSFSASLSDGTLNLVLTP